MKEGQKLWPLALLIALVIGCALCATLLVVLAYGHDDSGSRATRAARPADGAGREEGEAQGGTAEGIALDAASPSGGDEQLEAAAQARLDAAREEKRERFEAELCLLVESAIGRAMSPAERDSVTRASREYHAAIDANEDGEDPGARSKRINAARGARSEALAHVTGSKERAAQLIYEAMNALDGAAPGDDAGVAARAAP